MSDRWQDWAAPLGASTIRFSDAVPRGTVVVNWRDYEDTFTHRPTRSDYERGQMLSVVRDLDRFIADEGLLR